MAWQSRWPAGIVAGGVMTQAPVAAAPDRPNRHRLVPAKCAVTSGARCAGPHPRRAPARPPVIRVVVPLAVKEPNITDFT
jgi:hypothetical protein